MNLTIGNQRVALHRDSTLSLERLSPALNEKVGSFSYPFSVPTQPNQKILGWPGVLERTGELALKSFVVEDQGLQVLRGEVEYDTVTREDIGIILTSGLTELYTNLERMKDDGSNLSNLNWGSEEWFSDQPTTWELFQAKLTSWDANNRAPNASYLVSPFQYFPVDSPVIFANKHNAAGYLTQTYADLDVGFMYQLQFRAWWMVERIFEILGYTVLLNELKDKEWKQLVIHSRPFLITLIQADQELYNNQILVHPPIDALQYAFLMPTVSTYDFMEEMRILMGLAFDIDDLKKEVKILQLKSIIAPSESTTELIELSGWQHKEGKSTSEDGYSISFITQDNPLDNRADYTLDTTVATYSAMPNLLTTAVGYTCRVSAVQRDYIIVDDGLGKYWDVIGRLKPKVSGLQKINIEFNVKVPTTIYNGSIFKGPRMKITFTASEYGMTLYDVTEIYASLYRGTVTNFVIATIPFQTVPIPFLSADNWSQNETISLCPQALFESVYLEYLVWKSSSARSFVKFVRLTLPQLLALEWNSRYVISGVRVILSKINYDLPFTGMVRLEGYVV